MDGYVTTPVGPFQTAVGAQFNTFTSKQNISPVPVPVILPYQMRLGTKLKIEAEGNFSTTGTPTLVIGCFFGPLGASGVPTITLSFADSSAITTGSAAASWPWRLEYRGIVTGLGTAGSIVGQGNLELGTSLTASSTSPIPVTAALRTVAIDTTIARAVGICATWSASTASNTLNVDNLSVLLLN